jgi:hypothetical protein
VKKAEKKTFTWEWDRGPRRIHELNFQDYSLININYSLIAFQLRSCVKISLYFPKFTNKIQSNLANQPTEEETRD